MKLIGIIQARMTSVRCPGKVLRMAGGKALLGHHLDRVRSCKDLSQIFVATSTDVTDDPIEAFCVQNHVSCQRGSLLDVAARFSGVLKKTEADAFLRLNGDSPLLDPFVIQIGIGLFFDSDADLVTNVFPRSFPRGQSVEILKSRLFLEAEPAMMGNQREHITQYFYQNATRYRILNFRNEDGRDDSSVNLSVDTEDEFLRFKEFVEKKQAGLSTLGWKELLQAYWPDQGKVGGKA